MVQPSKDTFVNRMRRYEKAPAVNPNYPFAYYEQHDGLLRESFRNFASEGNGEMMRALGALTKLRNTLVCAVEKDRDLVPKLIEEFIAATKDCEEKIEAVVRKNRRGALVCHDYLVSHKKVTKIIFSAMLTGTSSPMQLLNITGAIFIFLGHILPYDFQSHLGKLSFSLINLSGFDYGFTW